MIKGGAILKSTDTLQNPSPYLFDMIREQHLTGDLLMCLDIADPRCMNNSSAQRLHNINTLSPIFFRGTSAAVAGSDPTFVGSIGLADEDTYFNFDGNDQCDAISTNIPETGQLALDNAKASILIMWWTTNATSLDAMWAADLSGIGSCFSIWLNASGSNDRMRLRHMTDNGGSIAAELSSINISRNSWHMLGLNYDESQLSLDFIVDKQIETALINASSRTTIGTMDNRIGSDVGGNLVPIDSRFACMAIWRTNIGLPAFSDLYSKLKFRRFNSLP